MTTRRRTDRESEAARRRDRTGGAAALILVLVTATALIGGAIVGVGLLGISTLRGLDVEIGPGSGTSSERLAVEVTPSTDLADRSAVRVTSGAFGPDRIVAVTLCLREADTDKRGVEACDLHRGRRFATDSRGRLDQEFAVGRTITVGGETYDCAAEAGRCLVVAADAGDFDRSGGGPISFRPGLPVAALAPTPPPPRSEQLPATRTPSGPQRRGTVVTVEASGFRPGEPLLVARCSQAFETGPPEEACEPVDGIDAVSVFMLGELPSSLPRADDWGRAEVLVTLAREVTPGWSGEPVDCTAAPAPCSIVVAAAADTRRSAVVPYELTP